MANNNNNQRRNNDPVTFEIMERIQVLGSKENGWTKEVNVVAWNGGVSKIDLREWDPEACTGARTGAIVGVRAGLLAESGQLTNHSRQAAK